jgi:hypothetical protein
MRNLFILNDPPYGAERAYNALRLAASLLKAVPSIRVTVFLLGDAVVAAKKGQKTPEGFYNMERMLHRVLVGRARSCFAALAWTPAASPMRRRWTALPAGPWTRSLQQRPRLTRSWSSEAGKEGWQRCTVIGEWDGEPACSARCF